MDKIEENPFVQLFPSSEDAKNFCLSYTEKLTQNLQYPTKDDAFSLCINVEPDDPNKRESETGKLLEKLLRVTINRDVSNCNYEGKPTELVFLGDLAETSDSIWIVEENICQAIFERLMKSPLEDAIIKTGTSRSIRSTIEKETITYLFNSYQRVRKEMQSGKKTATEENVLKDCRAGLVTNMMTALTQPDILFDQDPHIQLYHLFTDFTNTLESLKLLCDLMEEVGQAANAAKQNGDDDITVIGTIRPVLRLVEDNFNKASMIDSELLQCVQVLQLLAKTPSYAHAIVEETIPINLTNGRSYQDTLLGAALAISCLPKNETKPWEFFQQPSMQTPQQVSFTETSVWNASKSFTQQMFDLIHSLLKVSPEVRNNILSWIGNCLKDNAGRGKLWSSQVPEFLAGTNVSDGFMLNLGKILLQLCLPFCTPYNSKLLKIDATYCIVKPVDAKECGVHLQDMYTETMMVSPPDDQISRATSFSFTTECFFMTHRSLSLGYNVIHQRLVKLSQDLSRIRRFYEEERVQTGEGAEAVQMIKENMDKGMTQYLSLKTSLLEPETMENLLDFYAATANWLVSLAVHGNTFTFQPVTFPLPESVPTQITCVPEFIINNITGFLSFLRRFSPQTLAMTASYEHHLQPLITFILVFMGSPERMRNPHLRAELSEAMEALLPPTDEGSAGGVISGFNNERLFREHPDANQMVPTLLHVFVSIEMTGQSVAFEQKFNYRRPMYIIMDYLWKFEVHRKIMNKMAKEAEVKIEAANAPLFLRFINLLMNDAIFLLDEALGYMSKLREQQQVRDSGSWQVLPENQRRQNEATFQHMGMLARFHNVMGKQTIHMLELITQEIKSIFCHPTLVDRIASMLNYFLLHLVGPKKRNFKVKDLSEYEFKPQEIVCNICEIYLHLGDNPVFCKAVCNDGRSYSPELFTQAEAVLLRIGRTGIVDPLNQLAATFNSMAEKIRQEESELADAPDEFLDPILGTLMTDPVTLPSSKVCVDRATIARHLLSDQTDPFNRSPLSMEMVESNTDLKAKIEQWLKKK